MLIAEEFGRRGAGEDSGARVLQVSIYARTGGAYDPPLTRAPYDPGEVTTCEPSVVYGLGVTRRSRVLGSQAYHYISC